MNPDSPTTPREELEARLAALLLGELSADEAATVRRALAQDTELAKLHDRLQATIGLVREAVATQAKPAADQPPLKLSDERREKLLAHFKTVPLLPKLAGDQKAKRSWLIPMSIAAALVALVGITVLMPGLSRSKSQDKTVYLKHNSGISSWYSSLLPSLQEGVAASSPSEPASAVAPPTPEDVTESAPPPTDATLAGNTHSLTVVGYKPVALPKAGTETSRPQLAQQPPSTSAVVATTLSATESAPSPQAASAIMLPSDGTTEGATEAIESKREWSLSSSLRGFSDGNSSHRETPDSGLATSSKVRKPLAEMSPESLVNRHIAVDAGTIPQPLESIEGYSFGDVETASGSAVQPAPRVNVAGGRGRSPFITTSNTSDSPLPDLRNYYATLGIDLSADAGKSVVYDDRAGTLTVRATPSDLDVIQAANEVLTETPQQQAKATAAAGGAASDGFFGGYAINAPPPTAGARAIADPGAASPITSGITEGDRTLALGDTLTFGKQFYRFTDDAVRAGSRRPGGVQRQQLAIGGLEVLEDRFQEQEKQVRQAQTEVDRLRNVLLVQNQHPAPNPYSRTNLARIGKGRQIITDKLTRIRLDDVHYSGLPVSEVLRQLHSESVKRDPEKKGVNFIFNPNSIPTGGNIDPTTGLPKDDSTGIIVAASTSLSDVSLQDVLDTIAKASDPPLKYSIEEYAVVFSPDTSRTRKSRPAPPALIPQPEVQTSDIAFSTFSLNVSDVAFKLAAASLEKGQMPDAASVRAEEFINAFDYRDPEAPPGVPIAFAWERTRYPFAHNRDLLRFSLKTAAAGRQAGRPLNLVLLLDNSGSMERADRVQIIREALRVLAGQLQSQDKLSVITFARTPRLWVDGVAGDKSGEVLDQVGGLTPQGGTNLEEAMNLAYATALRHYLAGGINRVVLLTDGAANLGNLEPESLKQKVESHRKQGVAFDCFGVGWEGFNDDLLEVLSRNGDGRYGFINSPDEAATEFAGQLAGALKVAASDVKVQVEFNPKRVMAYRQIGYAKHQLTKEQFRDNTVDAAEIAAQEAGNALYTVEVNPAGDGPLCIVRCRFKIPGTTDYREHEWAVPYTGNAVSLEQASPAMRLAASASAFAEWLVVSPFAGEVTPDALLGHLSGVPEVYGADARPKKLEWMIRQAKSVAGK